MASDMWQIVTWSPVFNLKPIGEHFEQRMKVKIDHWLYQIKASLKSKTVYSFELIYSHGLVSGKTSLSMFFLGRPESVLLAGLAKPLVLKKCLCCYQEICFSFFTNAVCKFQKDVNSIIHGKMIILRNQVQLI